MFRTIRSDGRAHWPDDEQIGNYAQSPSRARSRLMGSYVILARELRKGYSIWSPFQGSSTNSWTTGPWTKQS
jgi:hypothetical protein